MRTPATAAREAVEGKDETLFQACWQIAAEQGCQAAKLLDEARCIAAIGLMSPEERRLYDIQEEKP